MNIKRTVRYTAGATVGMIATIVPIRAASASDLTLHFPAGVACSFALDVTGSGGNFAVRHEDN